MTLADGENASATGGEQNSQRSHRTRAALAQNRRNWIPCLSPFPSPGSKRAQ